MPYRGPTPQNIGLKGADIKLGKFNRFFQAKIDPRTGLEVPPGEYKGVIGMVNAGPPPGSTFDLQLLSLEDEASPSSVETDLSKALEDRLEMLEPSMEELSEPWKLHTIIRDLLLHFAAIGAVFDGNSIYSVSGIGDLVDGTILSGEKQSEIVVMLKSWPVGVSSIAKAIQEETSFECIGIGVADCTGSVSFQKGEAVVELYFATLDQLPSVASWDFFLPVDPAIVEEHLRLARRGRWSDAIVASNCTIQALVRILKDMRSRFELWESLDIWTLKLIAHHCVCEKKDSFFDLTSSFRRVLQLLSSGFFLPHSEGLLDPCEKKVTRPHRALSFKEQDWICCASQTMLRVISHGGARHILGLDSDYSESDILFFGTVWGEVEIYPSESVLDDVEEDEDMEVLDLTEEPKVITLDDDTPEEIRLKKTDEFQIGIDRALGSYDFTDVPDV